MKYMMQPNIRKEKERYIGLPSHRLRSTHSAAMWKYTAAELTISYTLALCMSELKKHSNNRANERAIEKNKMKNGSSVQHSTLHSEFV